MSRGLLLVLSLVCVAGAQIQILENPGFEEWGSNHMPEKWGVIGFPFRDSRIVHEGKYSCGGNALTLRQSQGISWLDDSFDFSVWCYIAQYGGAVGGFYYLTFYYRGAPELAIERMIHWQGYEWHQYGIGKRKVPPYCDSCVIRFEVGGSTRVDEARLNVYPQTGLRNRPHEVYDLDTDPCAPLRFIQPTRGVLTKLKDRQYDAAGRRVE